MFFSQRFLYLDGVRKIKPLSDQGGYLIVTAANVLSSALSSSMDEEIIIEDGEFGDVQKTTTNYFHMHKEACFSAAMAILPLICGFIKVSISRLWEHKIQALLPHAATHHLFDDFVGSKYPITLHAVLKILVLLLKNSPHEVTNVMCDQGLCDSLANGVFLFKQSSMYQATFKVIFAEAVINGSSQAFCEGMLAAHDHAHGNEVNDSGNTLKYNQKNANLLERMIRFAKRRFAERVMHEPATPATKEFISTNRNGTARKQRHCNHLLMGLILSLLNIVRLKYDEVRLKKNSTY